MAFSLALILIFTNFIFFIGFLGLLLSVRSSFFVIISIEIMTISINLNFLFFSIFLNDDIGIIFNFFIIIFSACEIVLILTYFIYNFKKLNNIDDIESFLLLKY